MFYWWLPETQPTTGHMANLHLAATQLQKYWALLVVYSIHSANPSREMRESPT